MQPPLHSLTFCHNAAPEQICAFLVSFEVDPYFPHEFPIYKLRNTSKQFCDIPSYPHMSYTWMPNATCTAWRANVLLYAIFLPAACNCRTGKLHYSLLLTASLQSPRGVADVQANCALTPLIYTAQDHSTAQVSLAGTPPNHHLELLVYYREPTAVSVVVEKGDPVATAGEFS